MINIYCISVSTLDECYIADSRDYGSLVLSAAVINEILCYIADDYLQWASLKSIDDNTFIVMFNLDSSVPYAEISLIASGENKDNSIWYYCSKQEAINQLENFSWTSSIYIKRYFKYCT